MVFKDLYLHIDGQTLDHLDHLKAFLLELHFQPHWVNTVQMPGTNKT